jgi:hypothetical protein
MKKLITICAAILMTANVFAQSPEKMSYQAVVRDGSNALVTSTAVGMQISILQGSPSGTAVYVETQTPTSNANGLVSLEIGAGTVVSGDFTTIDWENGPYFIQTETDPTGGSNYTITGTSQLLSVPYALHAKTSESFTGTITETDPIYGASVAYGITANDTANWNNDLIFDGDTTYWKVNSNAIYFNQGNVGIGTSSPNSKLNINNGSITLSGLGSQSGIITMTNANDLKLYSGPVGNPSSGIWFRSANVAGNVSAFSELMVIKSTGNVGIGTTSPARTLHVSAVMRLEPIATAPTSPAKGDMYFDNTINKLRVYDGTTWQNCW